MHMCSAAKRACRRPASSGPAALVAALLLLPRLLLLPELLLLLLLPLSSSCFCSSSRSLSLALSPAAFGFACNESRGFDFCSPLLRSPDLACPFALASSRLVEALRTVLVRPSAFAMPFHGVGVRWGPGKPGLG
jgi:hypothetical protein